MTLISATICMFRRAEDLKLTTNLKIREQDIEILFYLVRLLEDKKDEEQSVLLISRALLIPIVFALNPETHSVDPKKTLEAFD